MINFLCDCLFTTVKGTIGLFIILGGMAMFNITLHWIDYLDEKRQKRKSKDKMR